MLRFDCTLYNNDFNKLSFCKTFSSLESFKDYLKRNTHSFAKVRDYVPIFIPKDRKGRISVRLENAVDFDLKRYWQLWIHQIELVDKGIVFSDGKYTNGERFCSDKIRGFLDDLDKLMNSDITHKFVQMD